MVGSIDLLFMPRHECLSRNTTNELRLQEVSVLQVATATTNGPSEWVAKIAERLSRFPPAWISCRAETA